MLYPKGKGDTMTHKIFKVETGEYTGENWFIAFGTDWDGKEYTVTTHHVHASELSEVSGGARLDAELVCRLLNTYYGYFIDKRRFSDLAMGKAIKGNDEALLFAAVMEERSDDK